MPNFKNSKSDDYWRWKLDQRPQTLESKDIRGLAKYMKSKKCTDVVLMIGAGVSTSAGIPDFRSPGTGLYSNLERLNLPHPQAVFEIGYFRRNPVPFYTLAQELYPGKFRPTLTHSFIRLLHEKHILLKCFTQNIDTLERRAGIPDDKIIEAHGSFATQHCIDCKAPYDQDLIKVHIKEKTIPRCDGCNGLVKPDIVFFGESLPDEFLSSISLVNEADLLIVMGTSLQVHPFAMLAELPQDDIPRVLINMECVGDFADRTDDVLLLGRCDEMVLELCQELGWEKELMELWKETEGSVVIEEDAIDKEERENVEKEKEKEEIKEQGGEKEKEEDKRKDTKKEEPEMDEEVKRLVIESLTAAIEQSLVISNPNPSTTTTSEEKQTLAAPVNNEILEIHKPEDTSSTDTPGDSGKL